MAVVLAFSVGVLVNRRVQGWMLKKSETSEELLDWYLIGIVLCALAVAGGLLVLFDIVF